MSAARKSIRTAAVFLRERGPPGHPPTSFCAYPQRVVARHNEENWSTASGDVLQLASRGSGEIGSDLEVPIAVRRVRALCLIATLLRRRGNPVRSKHCNQTAAGILAGACLRKVSSGIRMPVTCRAIHRDLSLRRSKESGRTSW